MSSVLTPENRLQNTQKSVGYIAPVFHIELVSCLQGDVVVVAATIRVFVWYVCKSSSQLPTGINVYTYICEITRTYDTRELRITFSLLDSCLNSMPLIGPTHTYVMHSPSDVSSFSYQVSHGDIACFVPRYVWGYFVVLSKCLSEEFYYVGLLVLHQNSECFEWKMKKTIIFSIVSFFSSFFWEGFWGQPQGTNFPFPSETSWLCTLIVLQQPSPLPKRCHPAENWLSSRCLTSVIVRELVFPPFI